MSRGAERHASNTHRIKLEASLAGRREPRRLMIGVRGLIEIRQVAAVAGLGGTGEDSANVALRANHRGVRARQREVRLIVVERPALPLHRRVAH